MAYIFKKIKDLDNPYDKTTVTIESESATLPDLLQDFKDFLLASGFVIDGDLVIENITDEETD